MSVVSAIPDSSDAMRYSYLDDFLISFDGTSSAGSNTTDVGSSAEPERSFDLPNQNGVMNNEPPKLSGGDALVPSNGNNYQSKVDTNPLVTNGTLNDTEALTSLEFLYHETYITGIFNQLNPGGVWGFLITIVRFIYGLHQLNFFFLPTHKVKFRKFMKW
jgi:hypothetical protein